MTLTLPPTIDEHALEYLELKAKVELAKAVLDEKKKELVKLCRKNGIVPDGAEKSLRLDGDTYQITASFGTSSSIDETVVTSIRAELVAEGAPRLFGNLFHERSSHVVAPTAPAILAKCSKKVKALFARVMTTTPKEPSLKVEKREAKKGGKK